MDPNFRHFHTSSSLLKLNHYDVLELRQNCSDTDIRDAFVRLSKLHHPDSNQKVPIHGPQFQDIMAAYKVLGKSDSRQAYDHSLQFDYPYERDNVNTVEYDGQIFRPNKYGFPDPTNRDPRAPYYGISGLKKLPNRSIVILCLLFAGVGITAQFFAIRHSMTFKREKLDEISANAIKNHAEVRAEAEAFGNQVQIERLRRKLRSSE